MSPLLMAYIGDAVFELAVRSQAVAGRKGKISDIHQEVVCIVKAESQSKILRRMEPYLTDEELDIVRKGRNARSNSVPRHVGVADYRLSTGLEALFGYLFLRGDQDRLEDLLDRAAAED